jgi:hypothetical protein
VRAAVHELCAFDREVTASERWFVALNELRPPFAIQLLLEGSGDPEPEAMFDALERSTAVNPGARLVLEANGDDVRWTLGPQPSLTIVDAPNFEGEGRDDAPFLAWPLDAQTGPTCELVLVRGRHRTYLLFRALHAVMDGQGTLLWASDVLRALRREQPIGHPSPLTADALVREMKLKRRPPPENDALHPFGRPRATHDWRYHWRRIRVGRPVDSLMVGRIAVAIAREARTRGEGAVRINLPTDLRHLRASERSTANLFSALFIEVPTDASPEAIGLKVVQMLYRNEGTRPVSRWITTNEKASLDLVRVKALWDLTHLHDSGRYPFSATLSHLGALRSSALSAPCFRTEGACFIPLVSDSGCVISLNGLDEESEACVGLSDRFGGVEAIDRLAELVGSALAPPLL